MIIGLVGKPSSGKSTFFKAATLAEVEISPRPFTTIKKNEGMGFIRVLCIEKFFNVKCQPRHGFCINGERFVPIRLIDVAGLIPGAHLGAGLGNQFLDDLRQADALIHVIDISGSINERGEPVSAGSYDPANDIKFLEEELDMWFFSILKKGWIKFSRQVEMESKDLDRAIAEQFSGLNIKRGIVKDALQVLSLIGKKPTAWTDEDIKKLASYLRHKGKPIVIAANKIDVSTGKANYERLKKQFSEYTIIPCSAEAELALREATKVNLIEYVPGDSDFRILQDEKLNDKQKKALGFIKNLLKECKTTGVQKCLNTTVLDFLKYIVIFPGGVSKLADAQGRVLPDAFILPPGSTAYDFANHIHSDLAEGFVKAIDVKTRKAVGRDYILKHLDVMEIVSKK